MSTTDPSRRDIAAAPPPTVPLESAPHKRTWMAWPDSKAIWGRRLPGLQANIALVARTIAKYEPVILCANAGSVATAQYNCGLTVAVIGSIPVDDCWMRDSGPIFRIDGAGTLDAVALNFNGWGNRQTHAKDARVAAGIAAFVGIPCAAAEVVAEGGAIEADGQGTLMATKSSIINPNRNPGRTRAQIDAALCAAYGASKVIWFDGIAGRDITDDHVDATSRFTVPGAGLVQWPHGTADDVWANDARHQYGVLAAATDARGAAIEVVRLPGPDHDEIRQKSVDFVSSYANYYACNGAVISAQFGDARADAAARAVLAQIFPGRVIEQLDVDCIGNGGGGIHCVTQQEPLPGA